MSDYRNRPAAPSLAAEARMLGDFGRRIENMEEIVADFRRKLGLIAEAIVDVQAVVKAYRQKKRYQVRNPLAKSKAGFVNKKAGLYVSEGLAPAEALRRAETDWEASAAKERAETKQQ